MSWVAAAADNGGNASRQQTEEAQQKKISKVKWNCHHKGNPLLQSVILKSLRLPLALKNSTRSFLKSPSAKYLRVLNVEIEIVLQPYNRLRLSKKSTPKLSGGGVWCDSDHPFFCHFQGPNPELNRSWPFFQHHEVSEWKMCNLRTPGLSFFMHWAMYDSFSWNSIDSFRLTSISYTAYT